MTIAHVIDDPIKCRDLGSLSARFSLLVIMLFLLQGAVWIGLPLLFEGSIRLDVAEGVIDGPNRQLSYLRIRLFRRGCLGLAATFGLFRYAAVYALGWAFASGAFVILALFLRR